MGAKSKKWHQLELGSGDLDETDGAVNLSGQIQQVRESELLELRTDLEAREAQLKELQERLNHAEQERRIMHNKIQVSKGCGW